MARLSSCGCECGVSNSRHWDFGGSGLWSFSTTTVRSGLRSLRYNPSNSNATITFGSDSLNFSLTSSTSKTRRDYVRFTTLPNADCIIGWYDYSGSSAGWGFKVSDSKIYAAVEIAGVITFGSTGVSVTTGTWYRIDVKTVGSVVTGTADVRVNGVACGQATGAFAADSADFPHLGSNGVNITADIFFDDFSFSQTAGDYPLSDGYIKSYIPNADGAHNVAGANDFERSGTGTDITNATTDANVLVAKRPLPSAAGTYINGVAPPNATDYVEWQYEDSSEPAAPIGVEIIVVMHTAGGSGSCNATVTLREHAGATSAQAMNLNNNATALQYSGQYFATVPGTADAWTTTKFNALRSRFLVSDASPDPFVDAAMLEVEFPSTSGTLFTQNLSGSITSSGVARKQTNKRLAAANTPHGALSKRAARTFTSSLTPLGALAKRIARGFAGSIASAGALLRQVIYARSFAGSLASAGVLTRQVQKRLAATLTSAGSLTKATSRSFSGALTFAGVLRKVIAKAFSGASTSTGSLANQLTRFVTLSGTLTAAGSLLRQTSKRAAGSATSESAITWRVSKNATGSIDPAGEPSQQIHKGLAGTLTAAGAIAQRVSKAFAGAFATAGSVVHQAPQPSVGSVSATGSIAKTALKILGATLASSGALANRSLRIVAFAGSIASQGAVAKTAARLVAGGVAAAASATRVALKNAAGALTPEGEQNPSVYKQLAGTLTPAGALTTMVIPGGGTTETLEVDGALASAGTEAQQANKQLAGSASSASALVKAVSLQFVSLIASSGQAIKQVERAFIAALTPQGVAGKHGSKSFAGALTPAGDLTNNIISIEEIVLSGSLASSGAVALSIRRGRVRPPAGGGRPLQVPSPFIWQPPAERQPRLLTLAVRGRVAPAGKVEMLVFLGPGWHEEEWLAGLVDSELYLAGVR
jgi:hypothetical protein